MRLVGGRWKCDGCGQEIKPTETELEYGEMRLYTTCCYQGFSWEAQWDEEPPAPDGPRQRPSGLAEVAASTRPV